MDWYEDRLPLRLKMYALILMFYPQNIFVLYNCIDIWSKMFLQKNWTPVIVGLMMPNMWWVPGAPYYWLNAEPSVQRYLYFSHDFPFILSMVIECSAMVVGVNFCVLRHKYLLFKAAKKHFCCFVLLIVHSWDLNRISPPSRDFRNIGYDANLNIGPSKKTLQPSAVGPARRTFGPFSSKK